MEAISLLEAPVPSPAWLTVTPPPARSKRRARIFMVAGCLVAGMVLGGVVGAQRVAGGDAAASSPREGVVLSMIQTQPAFAGYEPICVLDVLERHFATPAAFFAASEGGPDSPEVKAAAVDVVTEC
jgi:hypothetical protein